jgi:PST family polysaccharide transporter
MTLPEWEPEDARPMRGPAASGTRAVVLNTAWLAADRLLGLALTGIVTVAVVRYLGAENFGRLSYAAAIVAMLAPLVQLGLDNIVVRDLVKEPDARPEILGTAFGLMLMCSALLAAALIGWAWTGGALDLQTRLMITTLASQYVFQSLSVIDFWFRSGLQSKYATWSSKTGLAANAILSLVLIRRRAGVELFAYAMLLEVAVTAALLFIWYRATAQSMTQWRFRSARAWTMLAAGVPLLIGSLAGSVYARIDLVLLRALTNERQTGLYAAAMRLTELWYFVPAAIVISVFPAMVRRQHDPARHARRMQALYDVMAAFGYAVAIPTALLAMPIMTLIFGAEFAGGAHLLAVHIWTLLLISIGMARSNWLVTEGLGKYYMWAGIGGAVINVAVDWMFIPRYGAIAAAWASVAAQAFVILGSSLLAPRLWPTIAPTLRAFAVPVRWRALKQSVEEALRGRI